MRLAREKCRTRVRRIQKHRAAIGERSFTGISKTTPEQLDLFAALSLPKP